MSPIRYTYSEYNTDINKIPDNYRGHGTYDFYNGIPSLTEGEMSTTSDVKPLSASKFSGGKSYKKIKSKKSKSKKLKSKKLKSKKLKSKKSKSKKSKSKKIKSKKIKSKKLKSKKY